MICCDFDLFSLKLLTAAHCSILVRLLGLLLDSLQLLQVSSAYLNNRLSLCRGCISAAFTIKDAGPIADPCITDAFIVAADDVLPLNESHGIAG